MRVRYPYLNNSQIVTAGKKRDEQLEKTPESEIYIQSILSINSSKRREINSDGRELWRNSEISRFNLPINTPDRYNRNRKGRKDPLGVRKSLHQSDTHISVNGRNTALRYLYPNHSFDYYL